MEFGRNSRRTRIALFVGVWVLLLVVVGSRPAAAAVSDNKAVSSNRQVQILDPFSLRILAVEAKVTGAAVNAVQAVKKDAGGPPVDVPVRRRPRSPFLPPGPPPWPPGPPPWAK